MRRRVGRALLSVVALAVTIPATPSSAGLAAVTDDGFEPVPHTVLGEDLAVQGSVAVDRAGRFHVVWREQVLDTTMIGHRRSDDGGLTWSQPSFVSPSNLDAFAPSLVPISDGMAVGYLTHVCGVDGCGYAPQFVLLDASGATVQTFDLADGAGDAVYAPLAMAADDEGLAVGWIRRASGAATVVRYDRPASPYLSLVEVTRTTLSGTGRLVGTSSPDVSAVVRGGARTDALVWRAGQPGPLVTIDLTGERFVGAAAAQGRLHVASVAPDHAGGSVAGPLEPARQRAEVRLRTAVVSGPLAGPPGAPVAVGTTPDHGYGQNVALAARAGLVALAWEDAELRRAVTASSVDGGATFGPASVVPGSLGADALQLSIAAPQASPDPTARFSWQVAETYDDPDGDGVLWPRLTPLSATPVLQITLDGCTSRAASALGNLTAFRWTVDGEEVAGTAACRVTRPLAADQPHEVTLVVEDDGGRAARTTQTVEPRELVVVSLGDGFASGEGAPTAPADLSAGTDLESIVDVAITPETWIDPACHRSHLAGPALAARRLEALDPHSSVTFVHLACSGASIASGDPAEPAAENRAATGGLLDPYQGVEPSDPVTDEALARPSQLDQLQALVGAQGREVDLVMLSVGAEDAATGQVIDECLVSRPSDPRSCDTSGTKDRAGQRLAVLPDRFSDLADALHRQHPELAAEPSRVLLTEYPDPATDQLGLANLRCVANSETVGQVAELISWTLGAMEKLATSNPAAKAVLMVLSNAANALQLLVDGGLVTDAEATWLRSQVLQRVNGIVRDAAGGFGWHLVDGITARSQRRGYCAPDTERWTTTLGESLLTQVDLHGGFHPNVAGHRAIGDALVTAAVDRVLPGVQPHGDSSGLPTAEGDLGGVGLLFRTGYAQPGESLFVANLQDRGATLEATDVRRLDRVAAPPAQFVAGWYQGSALAVGADAAVATWTQSTSTQTHRTVAAVAFVGQPEITLDSAELVQAADGAPRLAADKGAVVRVRATARLVGPVEVPVSVVVESGTDTVLDQTYQVRVVPGSNDIVLPPSGALLVPPEGAAWSLRVELTDPGADGPDLEPGSGDWIATDPLPVAGSRPLRLLFAPMAGSGVTCAQVASLARRSLPYAQAALAVPDDGVAAAYGGTALTAPGGCPAVPAIDQTTAGVTAGLVELNRLARLAGVDAIVGVVPPGWLTATDPMQPWGMALLGRSGDPTHAAYLQTDVFDSTLTHELTHTLGYDHNTRFDVRGLWAARRSARQGPDYLSGQAHPSRWVGAQTFDEVLTALGASTRPSPSGTGPAVRVSGRLSFEAGPGHPPTATLVPWESAAAADPPGGPSDLVAEQLDAGGDLLRTDPLPLHEVGGDFQVTIDASAEPEAVHAVVDHAIELDPATREIVLRHEGVVVAERSVTATAPTVTVTAPGAGHVQAIGEDLTITWSATDPDLDPDGAPLRHHVSISGDGGTTWLPLALDLEATSLTAPVPATVSGDEVVVRVVTTDGVRSGEGRSAPFTVASIERGPERIAYLQTLASDTTACPAPWDGCYEGIRTMAADGSDDRLVVPRDRSTSLSTRTRFTPWHPDWSPDGRRLAFSATAYYEQPPFPSNQLWVERSDLFTVDPAGGDRQRITAPSPIPHYGDPVQLRPHHYYCADWSPDGGRLAAVLAPELLDEDARTTLFSPSFTFRGYVVSMAADGTDLVLHGHIPPGASDTGGCPRWSPDGSQLLLGTRVNGCSDPSTLPTRAGGWTCGAGNELAVVAWPATSVDPRSLGTVLSAHPFSGSIAQTHPTHDGTALLAALPNEGSWGSGWCGTWRVPLDGSPMERLSTCPTVMQPAPSTNVVRYSPTEVRTTPDGRVALTQDPYYLTDPGFLYYRPRVCTVPDQVTADPPTAPTPVLLTDGHACLLGDGTTAPLPPTTGAFGTLAFDWSAGPVLEGGGELPTLPPLLADPVAVSAGGPYHVEEDVEVALDASASALLGAGDTGPDVTVAWDLDGDGSHDDATGPTPVVRFHDTDVTEVSVQITTPQGDGTATAAVTVVPTAPQIPPSNPLDAVEGTPSWIGPIPFVDPGHGGHTAEVVVDGVTAPTEVQGTEVWALVTVPTTGAVPASVTVCDDRPDPPCASAALELTGVSAGVVEGVAPILVAAAGGTEVTVLGRHLGGSGTVLVDGEAVPAVAGPHDRSLTFAAPGGPAGTSATVSVPGAAGSATIWFGDWRAVDASVVTEVDRTRSIALVPAWLGDPGADPPPGVPMPDHLLVAPPPHGRLLGIGADSDLSAGDGAEVGGALPDVIGYQPEPGFVGVDSFQVRARGDDRIATIRVKVGNEAPEAGADELTRPAGTETILDADALLGNDVDPDAEEWATFAAPASLTAAAVGSETLVLASVLPDPDLPGEVWLDGDGVLRLRLAPDSAGPSGFTYAVADPHGGVSVGAVTLQITQVPGSTTTTTTTIEPTPTTGAPTTSTPLPTAPGGSSPSTPVAGGTTPPTGSGGGPLPRTGQETGALVTWAVGALVVGAGLVLGLARRRRQAEDRADP